MADHNAGPSRAWRCSPLATSRDAVVVLQRPCFRLGTRLASGSAPLTAGPQRSHAIFFGSSCLAVGGAQRLVIASRTAGTTSCAQRFSVSSLMLSPGGTK